MAYNQWRKKKAGMVMCGRYYIDDAAVKAIVTLVRSIDRDLRFGKKRDIYPSNEGLALYDGVGQVAGRL